MLYVITNLYCHNMCIYMYIIFRISYVKLTIVNILLIHFYIVLDIYENFCLRFKVVNISLLIYICIKYEMYYYHM